MPGLAGKKGHSVIHDKALDVNVAPVSFNWARMPGQHGY